MNSPAVSLLPQEKYWTVGQFPLFDHVSARRLLDVPAGIIVDVSEITGKWASTTYAGKAGYCKNAYLEPYKQIYQQNVVTIENQTPSPYDAAQYYILQGGVRHNACGPLCICSIMGDSMGGLSNKYALKSPPWWQRIILKDSTTSLDDLVHILVNVYGHKSPVRLQTALINEAGMRFTPGRMAAICENNAVIVGVRIAHDGYLARSGVAHWVVVRNVLPNGIDGGRVEIYNPFTNAIEWYSWREFEAAAGTPVGICVNKTGQIALCAR